MGRKWVIGDDILSVIYSMEAIYSLERQWEIAEHECIVHKDEKKCDRRHELENQIKVRKKQLREDIKDRNI